MLYGRKLKRFQLTVFPAKIHLGKIWIDRSPGHSAVQAMFRKIALLSIGLAAPALIYSGNLKGQRYFITLHEKDEEQSFNINRFRFVHMTFRIYDTFGLAAFIPPEEFGAVVKNLYDDLRKNYQKRITVTQFQDGRDLTILFKFLRFKEQKEFGFYVVTNYDIKTKSIASENSSCGDCYTLWYLYDGDLLTDYKKKAENPKPTSQHMEKGTFDDLNKLATKLIFDDSKANDMQITDLLNAGFEKAQNEKEKMILLTTYIEYLLYRDDLPGVEKKLKLFDEVAQKVKDEKSTKLAAFLRKYVGLLIQGYRVLS